MYQHCRKERLWSESAIKKQKRKQKNGGGWESRKGQVEVGCS